MKKAFLLLMLLTLSISCNLVNKHYHDGEYVGDMGFFEIKIEINGNEIIVNHSIAGTSKLECKQFEDYIEVVETGGIKRIIKALENGDLEYSEGLIFKRIKSEGNEEIKTEPEENLKEIKKSEESSNKISEDKEELVSVTSKSDITILKYCDDLGYWYFIVKINGNKITIESYPGDNNSDYSDKKHPREIVKGEYIDGKIIVPKTEDLHGTNEGSSTTTYKIIGDSFYQANYEDSYNEYFRCN